MQNEMRDRLMNLVIDAEIEWQRSIKGFAEVCADHLIKNGVIVLPCKVGDTVYCVDTILKTTEKCKVYGVGFFKDERIQLYVDDGECKYVTDNWCNTKEEAEQKLKGGAK